MFNAACAMSIPDLISQVHFESRVNMLPKHSKYPHSLTEIKRRMNNISIKLVGITCDMSQYSSTHLYGPSKALCMPDCVLCNTVFLNSILTI